MVEHVKEIIKGGKGVKSDQKLRALVLLDRCVVKAQGNLGFIDYVQSKIMKRLVQMAEHCPAGTDVSDPENLRSRGASIFLQSQAEPDPESASSFLIYLLDCIE